ncbi:MAG: hypothetical protein DMH00_01785 [Acidobacteria bacterium]|nr:MAG: hypothetical protein DMH00_01785 [Acidobacteriota bacterium]
MTPEIQVNAPPGLSGTLGGLRMRPRTGANGIGFKRAGNFILPYGMVVDLRRDSAALGHLLSVLLLGSAGRA